MEYDEHIEQHEALGTLTRSYLNGRYVKVSGDSMTGDLIFPNTGFIMTDSNDVMWRITISNEGALTTAIAETESEPGFPFGFTLGSTFIS